MKYYLNQSVITMVLCHSHYDKQVKTTSKGLGYRSLGEGLGGVNSREAESELLKQGCLVEAFLPPDWMKEGYMGVALCPRG